MDYNLERIQELYQYKRRLSAALRSAQVCIFEVDIKRQLYTFFENSESIFGITEKQILDDVRPFHTLGKEEFRRKIMEYFVHPNDEKAAEDAVKEAVEGRRSVCEVRMKAASSNYIWCRINITPVIEGDGTMKIVGIISNIQDFKERIDFLSKENQLDSFTRLYTKKRFEELCYETIRDHPQEKMAFIILDLDDFKEANDHFGHQAADDALLAIAAMLKRVFRRQDILARFGGDEFVILMHPISNVGDALDRAEHCLQFRSDHLRITKSMGIALYPDDGKDYRTLMEQADRALYWAKKTKNTYMCAGDVKE